MKLLTFALLLLSALTYAAHPVDTTKRVEALLIEKPLKIDAVLDENCYKQAVPATDFLQLMPFNGKPAMQPSKVWFFYDQTAVYLGAMLYDSAPDSIYNYVTERDNIGMSDYFGVYLDPYNQGQLAYGFFINPAGVQTDIKAIKKEHDNEDGSWDAVWESKTRITDKGWIVEMKIPYSALRFPEHNTADWGMNMFRRIRRFDSNNSWNFVDRNVSGFIHQQGRLGGIKDIKPPVRLSFSPYAATYLEFSGSEKPHFLYKGGLDLKYGLSESHTLDMMVIPDFGQVQSDDQELNLSPYELYFDERRQFFNEGTELFQRADIFYSRRIGAAPVFGDKAGDALKENEVVNSLPTETQLVNATKITGRSPKGLAIGVLNAMSLPSDAEIRDTLTGDTRKTRVQPFTNYNVLVLDQSLKNNSYVSFINTNVSMWGNPFYANVSGTQFLIRDKSKTYAVQGSAAVSNRLEDGKTQTGFKAKLQLEKNSGKWQYTLLQKVIDDTFNPNDLGYLRRNNEVHTELMLQRNIIEPFWIFREMFTQTWYFHSRIYDPFVAAGNEWGIYNSEQFKNYYYMEWNTGYNFKHNDYYEPRVDGRYFTEAGHTWINLFLRTDNRKIFTFWGHIGSSRYVKSDKKEMGYDAGVNMKAGKRLNLEYELEENKIWNDRGYVGQSEDESTVWFGRRDVAEITNTLSASYAFNNELSMRFRARHYWSCANYLDYYLLNTDGSLSADPSYSENEDVNFNVFNIDMSLRWVFAPGSEMSLAWKLNSLDVCDDLMKNYFSNLDHTLSLSQTNSISLKVLYYIDYNTLVKKHYN
ncbi:DUF5916 domain-containing protein [Saccharicrinis sp. FJH54]|uniref:DUF5916 domain-containing protein n=1 Tax=Saccharicrinis sp. FJH54 TaxID=3344665 RepID=UPI0035D4EB18